MTTNKVLSARLREMWTSARENGMASDDCAEKQQRELDKCSAVWTGALLLPGQDNLVQSTLIELGRWRGISDLALVRRRCEDAMIAVKARWQQTVQEVEPHQVEKYYDAAEDYIEELMWWHTLEQDNSPLAYVAALEFASLANCTNYLDFGAGVGSGGLLFQHHGLDVTLADISGAMQSFCKYRFNQRGRAANFVDLKESTLPDAAFDFITAMDVFEHLVNPVGAVDSLDRSLKPGGYVYGRFAAEDDPDRPQHIVTDFGPVFERFAKLGFKEVFRDDWLWGHQVFQKIV